MTPSARFFGQLLCLAWSHAVLEPALAAAWPPLQVDAILLAPRHEPPIVLAQAGESGMDQERAPVEAASEGAPEAAPAGTHTRAGTAGGDESMPTLLKAERLRGVTGVETLAEGNAEVTRGSQSVSADRITFRHAEEEVAAEGHVRIVQEADVVTGEKALLRLDERTGFIDSPRYAIQRKPDAARDRPAVTAYGGASRIEFQSDNRYRLSDATYSTCTPDNGDWYAAAERLDLDFSDETGYARNARVVFKDVPILYTPYLEFPLNDRRKSGLLPPTLGNSTNTGVDLTVPFYWNIAPNMDATVAPRYMTRRGLMLGGEFRYLQPRYSGQIEAEYLPNDRVYGGSRASHALRHVHRLTDRLTGALELNGVSDATYFRDLSSRISSTAQRFTLRQGSLSYVGGWWRGSVSLQQYNLLEDPSLPPVEVPYERLPQAVVSAARIGPLGVEGDFEGEFVHFQHPTKVKGRRLFLYPSLSRKLSYAGVNVTPRVGVHFTRYDLKRQAAGAPDQVTRTIPIGSLDANMVFERTTDLDGQPLIQTLEPRVYYLYAAYRDQSTLPVFDSGLKDFNFAQIFSENEFSGHDRINDANQITAAVTTRLISPSTGAELLRAAIGQRYHFRDQKVTLPGTLPRAERTSDIIAGVSGRAWRDFYVDALVQYSTDRGSGERVAISGRYQPLPSRVLNAGYRFKEGQFEEIDVSAQWPMSSRWSGVARYNYSVRERSLVEALGGIEYQGGCWAVRGIFHRFATAEGTLNTAFFVQLELNGFSRIGSNPEDLLKRNIPGYGNISRPGADPVFGAQ